MIGALNYDLLIYLGYHCWNKCCQGDMPAYTSGNYFNFLVLGHMHFADLCSDKIYLAHPTRVGLNQ
jgi:hypothetical protein